MWSFFKKKNTQHEEHASVWKSDFSDCVAADYLPAYSVCQNGNNRDCRFVVRYAGMILCSHSDHKTFIPEDAEMFNPHKGQFSD
jgi:hypothetical protein